MSESTIEYPCCSYIRVGTISQGATQQQSRVIIFVGATPTYTGPLRTRIPTAGCCSRRRRLVLQSRIKLHQNEDLECKSQKKINTNNQLQQTRLNPSCNILIILCSFNPEILKKYDFCSKFSIFSYLICWQ